MNDSWPPRSQFKASAAVTLLFWRKWAKQRQRSAGPLKNVIQQVFQVLNTQLTQWETL